MSGIGYYYDENGVKQEMEIGPSFDDFPGMAEVISPIPICDACKKASFDKNDEIKYVYIPSSVKDISAGAFNGCTDLQG